MKNDGEQPIYDCHLNSALDLSVPADQADKEPTAIRSEMYLGFGVIPPGVARSNVSFIKIGKIESAVNIVGLVNRSIQFHVSFTDTEGRSWIRNEKGRLQRTRQIRQ